MFELFFAGPGKGPPPLGRESEPFPEFPRSRGANGRADSRLLAEAERELRVVHRRELARLLLQAAGLTVRDAEKELSLTTFPLPRISLGTWRRRTRRALRLGAGDGIALPASALLRRLLGRPPSRWPRKVRLTRVALETSAGLLGELCHAHALLVSGRLAPAEEGFRAILENDPPPTIRWRAYEGLAAVHAGAGRLLLAMGAMEAAADEPACGIGPLASGLYLALRVGDSRRCRRAAARLDLLVSADDPAFLAALGRLRAHLRAEEVRCHRPPAALSRAEIPGLAREGRSPAERLLRALG